MVWPGPPSRLALPPSLQRLHLARAAQRYASHGWPVIPGAPLVGDRFDCGEPGCMIMACHPAAPDWESTASVDRVRIDEWWQRASHGVLLLTGHAFDVLEVAGAAGWHMAQEVRGPVAVAEPLRWMFLVQPGATLSAELREQPNVVLHGKGSWIPAPPTPLPTGPVRWEARPRRREWALPDLDLVQRAAARMLRFDRQPRRVWPQMNATLPSRESSSNHVPPPSLLT
jgi:hypothetical protein